MRTDAHKALFRLSNLVRVERAGPRSPLRRVIHVLDYHALPDGLAKADGLEREQMVLADALSRVGSGVRNYPHDR